MWPSLSLNFILKWSNVAVFGSRHDVSVAKNIEVYTLHLYLVKNECSPVAKLKNGG